ncbi:MAG: transcriptional regulator, partial [Betaproteobacteria bacterium]|nr:transcriptional regulator [Betaproteobacteria bacterium]
VEIHNPGGPFGEVTRENFGQPGLADYRNPNLAEAMKTIGHVQRFGIGIKIARDLLAKAGHPQIEFTPEPSHMLATVRPVPAARKE